MLIPRVSKAYLEHEGVALGHARLGGLDGHLDATLHLRVCLVHQHQPLLLSRVDGAAQGGKAATDERGRLQHQGALHQLRHEQVQLLTGLHPVDPAKHREILVRSCKTPGNIG